MAFHTFVVFQSLGSSLGIMELSQYTWHAIENLHLWWIFQYSSHEFGDTSQYKNLRFKTFKIKTLSFRFITPFLCLSSFSIMHLSRDQNIKTLVVVSLI